MIAFGGNALNVPGDHTPVQKEEFIVARRSMEQLAPLLQQGYETLILTHGNGPQVGQIFLKQELTAHEFPRQITLDVCVADSQGRIGYILQNVFDNVCQQHGINKKSFSVITQVVVDPKDPGFDNPACRRFLKIEQPLPPSVSYCLPGNGLRSARFPFQWRWLPESASAEVC